jgi:hypothetical protein
MAIDVNGDSVPCLLTSSVFLDLYEIFGGKFCVHLQIRRVTTFAAYFLLVYCLSWSRILKVEAIYSSETSVDFDRCVCVCVYGGEGQSVSEFLLESLPSREGSDQQQSDHSSCRRGGGPISKLVKVLERTKIWSWVPTGPKTKIGCADEDRYVPWL